MQKFTFLLLLALPLGTVSQACEADGSCENDAESLVQSQVIVSQSRSHSKPEHAKELHVAKTHETEEQRRLHAELKNARRARQQALASLKELDDRLDDLHTKLSASQLRDDGSPDKAIAQQHILHKQEMVQLATLIIALIIVKALIIMYMWRTVSQYEANRDKDKAIPWYHDSACMERMLGAIVLLWCLFGITIFTQVMIFTEDHRHLSIVESLYLTVQIVTTVGYGDLTPSTNIGKVIMVFYALTGVTFVGALAQQYLLSESEGEGQESGHKQRKLWKSLLPVIICVVFGTLFYNLYPGENKTIFESFYMSIVTLLTIGFGTYHPSTAMGKLLGSIWMLIGVAFVGQAMVELTERMFEKRKNLHTKAASMKLFAELDSKNTGQIGRMEFIQFELTRHGVPKGATMVANKKFDELDANGTGTLDYEEFEKYVITLEG